MAFRDPTYAADLIVTCMADLLSDGDLVFVGLNSHHALLAAAVAKLVHGKRIRVTTVAEGYEPSLADIQVKRSTGDPELAGLGAVMPTVDAFDLAQKGKVDVMFLGPAQIDSDANVNVSVIGQLESPKVRLPGGAAAAFILPLVRKAVLWNFRHGPRSLVRRVDFVTATARNASNRVLLCTDLCLLEHEREKRAWRLLSVHPWSSVDEVIASTGFDVTGRDAPPTREPTREEREVIARLDPENLRTKPFSRA
ncbi:MAG: CoA-transferase [Nitrososphaerota archaeon]|nr:CoA-transferase subunit beta [Candidatus Calditenuis fumarioli]